MSDIMIRAESISKLYKIGALKQRHDTLCGQLVHSFTALFTYRLSYYGERTIYEILDPDFGLY